MTIICLEGASSVGKSTTCQQFATQYDAFIVPETGLLFESPQLDGKELMMWLLERQIDRWHIAYEKNQQHEYVILDGDVFKIWYSWIYGYEHLSLDETANFFREKLLKNEISLPDAYVLFWAEEDELRKRKEMDQTRSRRNFDKHLRMIEPQMRYFHYLNELVPGYVGIHKTETVADNIHHIVKHSETLPDIKKRESEIFDKVIDFYKSTTP